MGRFGYIKKRRYSTEWYQLRNKKWTQHVSSITVSQEFLLGIYGKPLASLLFQCVVCLLMNVILCCIQFVFNYNLFSVQLIILYKWLILRQLSYKLDYIVGNPLRFKLDILTMAFL